MFHRIINTITLRIFFIHDDILASTIRNLLLFALYFNFFYHNYTAQLSSLRVCKNVFCYIRTYTIFGKYAFLGFLNTKKRHKRRKKVSQINSPFGDWIENFSISFRVQQPGSPQEHPSLLSKEGYF